MNQSNQFEVGSVFPRMRLVVKQLEYSEERNELLQLLKQYRDNPFSMPMHRFDATPELLNELIDGLESDFEIVRRISESTKVAELAEINGVPVADMFDDAIKRINDYRDHYNKMHLGEKDDRGETIQMLPHVPRFNNLTAADVNNYIAKYNISRQELEDIGVPVDLFEGLQHFTNNKGFLGQQFYITHLPMKGIGRAVRLWNIFPTKHNRTAIVGVYRLSHVIPSTKDVLRMQPLADDTPEAKREREILQHPHYVFGKA